MPLLVHQLTECTPERFVRLAQGMAGEIEAPDSAPRLLIAELTGDLAFLGRHQRRGSAVRAEPCARRFGGGRAIAAGEGVIGVLLGVHDFGVPPDRVLNRSVRGLNRGLTRCLNVPVTYFGRDHLVAGGGQLAVVSQETRVFEALVARRRPLALPAQVNGYPQHSDPRLGAPRWTLLGDAPFAKVARAVAEGYASQLNQPIEEVLGSAPASAEGPGLVVDEDEDGWQSSGVAEVAIGFVEAWVRLLGNRVAAARIRGDFIAPTALVRAIEAKIAGSPVDVEELTRRVSEAYRGTAGAFIHGVLNLGIFAEAVVEAATAKGG